MWRPRLNQSASGRLLTPIQSRSCDSETVPTVHIPACAFTLTAAGLSLMCAGKFKGDEMYIIPVSTLSSRWGVF